jgi:predicted acetyltransferase
VRLKGGRARVEPGASGPALRCDIRALAPIYSGLYTASQAAALGMISGDDEAIAAADRAFAGPAPWMPDHF